MTIIIKLICSFFISFFCLSSFALGAVSPGKIELPAMPESSNGSKKGQLKNLGLSYSLMDLQTGKLVDSKFPSKPRSLASVSKLLTFYFALEVLGPKDNFKTEVYKEGQVVNGVLKGNLYLKGYGAPYFTASHILSLIHQIKGHGIKKVEGEFLYDGLEQFSYPRISEIGLEDQADNPSLGALNVEFNRFKVWTRLNIALPPLNYFVVKSERAPRGGPRFKFDVGERGNEVWKKNSAVRMRSLEDLPSKNSNRFTSSFFHYLAGIHGLQLNQPKEKKVPSNAKILGYHEGLPLIRLASLGLEYSNNLIAEMAMLKAVKKLTGEKRSLEESAYFMHEWFKKSFPKINWGGSSLTNASGLTVDNKMGPKNMVDLLLMLKDKKFNKRSFWSLLSINGHSGGLSRRLRHPEYAFRVYGKTGSLFYVNNLAGYLLGKSGKKYAFALFAANDKKRHLLSMLDPLKGRVLRRGSGSWRRRALRKMDRKLEEWLKSF
tara:strand:+ start:5906 stop:7372 length:1467 start_codon:yes stop_codon:yes gene_type:complete